MSLGQSSPRSRDAEQPLDTGCRCRAGPAWCRWDRKALGTSGDRSEEEEGRWICFAKGVGLLAVGGLLYAPIPLACHSGYLGTTVIFLSISTSV